MTDDMADALCWAFSASPEDGVPALLKLTDRLSVFDQVDLRSISSFSSYESSAPIDARELMTTLISVNFDFASPAQLALYVVIVARVHRALFVETVARRRRLINAQHMKSSHTDEEERGAAKVMNVEETVYAGAFRTMRAWSRDLVPLLVQYVLPQLCLRDAQPQTVSTSQQLAADALRASPFVDGDKVNNSDGKQKSTTTTEDRDQLLLTALATYQIPCTLIGLVDAVYRTTHDASALPLLLAVYATLSEMEPYVEIRQLQHAGCAAESVLQRWRIRFLGEVDEAARLSGSAKIEVNGSRLVAAPAERTTGSETVIDIDTCMTELRVLLNEIVQTLRLPGVDNTWSFIVSYFNGVSFPLIDESTMFADDLERGAAPPDTTAALLAKEYKDEIEALTLVTTDLLDAMDSGSDFAGKRVTDQGCELSSPLCQQGALFLLADVLRDAPVDGPAHYTTSSTSLLLCIAAGISTALTCASKSGLMRQLLFLHDVVVTVPKYSIDCAGENVVQPTSPTASETTEAKTLFDVCLTKRYEAFFAIEKELLSVSALCPSDEHRRAARVIALEVLERLTEEPRVRMHLALLTLCPYPSIARFFLERLLEDWRVQQGQHGSDERQRLDAPYSSPLAYLVPMGLGECMTTFLQHLTSGTRGFLDPLVVTLNFLRVSASRHNWIRTTAQRVANSDVPGKEEKTLTQSQPKQEASVLQAWSHLFRVVGKNVLPQCDALVNPPATTAAASPFALPALSTLDAFSLSCAMDGVKALCQQQSN